MGIQHNMATIIRLIMQQRQKTLAEFSEELEISRSALQAYLREEGNPSISTVEHLAKKLDVDPAVLVTGLFEPDQAKITLMLFEIIRDVAELPEDKKQQFGERIAAVIELWDD